MTEKEQTAREAELARREAALAAREAQLEQEQAKLEAARAEAPEGRKTFLNNNDPDFVNPKEKLYDKFPLTVHQMDIIIGVHCCYVSFNNSSHRFRSGGLLVY